MGSDCYLIAGTRADTTGATPIDPEVVAKYPELEEALAKAEPIGRAGVVQLSSCETRAEIIRDFEAAGAAPISPEPIFLISVDGQGYAVELSYDVQ